MSWSVFTQNTPAPGSSGGLINAIYGSVVMTLLGLAHRRADRHPGGHLSVRIRPRQALSTVIRFINDVLLSAPSIVIGLFVYTLVVVPMGHFSAIAGAISLGIIAIPVTVRTGEDMLRLVPMSMRQARPASGRSPGARSPASSIPRPAAGC